MLQNIKIEGFKSIRNLDLNLSPINILIGANGVGKSNFISFFELTHHIYEQRLQQYSLTCGVDDLLHYGRKNTQEIKARLDFGNNAYAFALLPSDNDSLFIAQEDSILPHQDEYNHSFWNKNIKESQIKTSNTIRDIYLRNHLESFKTYHFHDTSKSSVLRSSCNIYDNKFLKENGANLPAFLYFLKEKHPKNFKRIEYVVKSVVPFFDAFDLSPNALKEDSIRLEWKEFNRPEMYFNAMHLSDGSLRFIALVTLLMQPNLPKLIIIDEPELGLHPMAIEKLAALIKSAAETDCQIIISTQSVNLLNNFESSDVITVDREGQQSVFRRLNEADLSHWIEDYSLGELWTKSIIKGQTS